MSASKVGVTWYYIRTGFLTIFSLAWERGGVSWKEYVYIVNLNAVVKNERNRQIMVENCVKMSQNPVNVLLQGYIQGLLTLNLQTPVDF